MFWIAGYVMGAFAWMIRAPVVQLVESIGLTADASQALLAGLFGSFVMVFTVLFYSFLTSSS